MQWSIRKLGAIAQKIAERLNPGATSQQKKAGQYESRVEERRVGDKGYKKTFISFSDMYKQAKAGKNTSIKATGRI